MILLQGGDVEYRLAFDLRVPLNSSQLEKSTFDVLLDENILDEMRALDSNINWVYFFNLQTCHDFMNSCASF